MKNVPAHPIQPWLQAGDRRAGTEAQVASNSHFSENACRFSRALLLKMDPRPQLGGKSRGAERRRGNNAPFAALRQVAMSAVQRYARPSGGTAKNPGDCANTVSEGDVRLHRSSLDRCESSCTSAGRGRVVCFDKGLSADELHNLHAGIAIDFYNTSHLPKRHGVRVICSIADSLEQLRFELLKDIARHSAILQFPKLMIFRQVLLGLDCKVAMVFVEVCSNCWSVSAAVPRLKRSIVALLNYSCGVTHLQLLIVCHAHGQSPSGSACAASIMSHCLKNLSFNTAIFIDINNIAGIRQLLNKGRRNN